MPSGQARLKYLTREGPNDNRWRVSSPRFGPDHPAPILRTTDYQEAYRLARTMANNLNGDFKSAVAWARKFVPFKIKIRHGVDWASRPHSRDNDNDTHIFELNAACIQPIPELFSFLAYAMSSDRIRKLPLEDEVDGAAIWGSAYHQLYEDYQVFLERKRDGRRKNSAGHRGSRLGGGSSESAGDSKVDLEGSD